ncbi:MAG: hypothetical protein C1941_01430 [Prosthecochloris sp.]|nr:hypothetical protein [Prosthecochloris sp.]
MGRHDYLHPSTQHSALSTQHSALSTQHSALSTQHSALSTQHSALSTQHSAQPAGRRHYPFLFFNDSRSLKPIR